jgi:hypothetical protein
MLTGLPVDGFPVLGDSPTPQQFINLLGKSPPGPWLAREPRVPLKWLQDNYMIVEERSPQSYDYSTRAYILFFLGTIMCADSSTKSVPLKYLLLLEDFNTCGQYAWGAAALSYMYKALSRASRVETKKAYGWFSLVQVMILKKFNKYRIKC